MRGVGGHRGFVPPRFDRRVARRSTPKDEARTVLELEALDLREMMGMSPRSRARLSLDVAVPSNSASLCRWQDKAIAMLLTSTVSSPTSSRHGVGAGIAAS
jgi:hypothetical protein